MSYIFLNVLYIKQKSLKQILTYPLYLRGGGGGIRMPILHKLIWIFWVLMKSP